MKRYSDINDSSDFCMTLFLIFLILKLAEIGVVANWSWWWVTAPLWGGFAIIAGIAVLLVTAGCVVWLCQKLKAILNDA